ncbi:putative nucleic acid-binding Zn-ribbon protein [Bradyrhizobium sp. USDA 4354]
MSNLKNSERSPIPFFGARKYAETLIKENEQLERERDEALLRCRELSGYVTEITDRYESAVKQLEQIGGASLLEVEARRKHVEVEVANLSTQISQERAHAEAEKRAIAAEFAEARRDIVETREIALLQEVGVYEYNHPLTDAVAYQAALERLEDAIKSAVKKDGGAILASTNWQVNGSAAEGEKMVREASKLMLRAFNAEADNLVRTLKPYKLDSAIERLSKVEETIRKLGKTMQLQVSPAYFQLRVDELRLTADFLQKQSEEKEKERQQRERMREERKAQQEIAREKAKLERERLHYENAFQALEAKGDQDAMRRLREQIAEVNNAIESVEARAANTRAGYVYVISNIGSFGEEMVKVGMTRRLDPMERIRELSDASVPFNFDVHALFFSNDAVSIEAAMHERLGDLRVNAVNRRREFFRARPSIVKALLSELAGELLEFHEAAEAIEYRQTLNMRVAD